MKPTEFRKIRQDMNLTQGELAKVMGVTITTVARWELGLRKLPDIAANLLLCIRSKYPKK